MDFDWEAVVRTIAPTIATALGGPLAGLGVKAISEAVFGHQDGTEEEISLAVQGATPEILAAIKAKDQEFKMTMEKLGIDLLKLDYEDAASARKRQMAVQDITPDALAYLLLTSFIGALMTLFWVTVPVGNEKLIYTMLGSLGTLTIAAMAYFHGSSRGSAKKDAAMLERNKGG